MGAPRIGSQRDGNNKDRPGIDVVRIFVRGMQDDREAQDRDTLFPGNSSTDSRSNIEFPQTPGSNTPCSVIFGAFMPPIAQTQETDLFIGWNFVTSAKWTKEYQYRLFLSCGTCFLSFCFSASL